MMAQRNDPGRSPSSPSVLGGCPVLLRIARISRLNLGRAGGDGGSQRRSERALGLAGGLEFGEGLPRALDGALVHHRQPFLLDGGLILRIEPPGVTEI